MRIQRITGFIIAFALSTVAMADPAPSTEADRGARCLRPADIDGFIDAHRDHIVLTDGGRHYRATFFNDCIGIDYANGLAAEAKASCLDAGDSLSFRDHSGMPQSCIIQSLSYIPKDKKP